MGRAYQYVILGGGTAAGYAAHEFVQQGVGHGNVCIISDEAVPPYERPALSKGYLLPDGAVRLPAFHTCVGVGKERQLTKWYKDNGVELLLSNTVVAADVNRKQLTTAAGETITYQTLLVATGARVLRLEEFGVTGANCRKICYLRDLRDASSLVDTMAECRGGRAVVIGGGYIGMEVAAALVMNSISVTMVFPESHCMARLFTPEIAEFYEGFYRTRGVTFLKGTVMEAFEQNSFGDVAAVVLKDGTQLDCDMVVVGIGISPNISLFEGQLAIEQGGIRVNSHMRSTSHSSVYAIGDVAAFPLRLDGSIRRLEHVDHARKSAAHAVACLLQADGAPDYDYLPYFYSRVFSLSWQFFGVNTGECVIFGLPKSRKFGAFWVDHGRIIGAFLEGGTQDEYAAMAQAARLQPEIPDKARLASMGLAFARELAESTCAAGPAGGLAAGSAEAHASILTALTPSQNMVQAAIVVAVAAAVAAGSYWYGRRRRRF